MSDSLERELLLLGSDWRNSVPQSLRMGITAIGERAADSIPAAEAFPTESRGWRSPLLAGAALIGMVGSIVAIPGARVVVARQIDRVLQALRIAPHTDLFTHEMAVADDVAASARQHQRELDAGRMWSVRTVYGSVSGSVPKGAAPDVRRVDRPDVLISAVPIRLLAPSDLYRGEPVDFDHALLAPDGVVFTFFGHGAAELFLIQAPVARGQQMAFSRSVSGPGGTFIGVAPSIEVLIVNGQRLTWDPDTTGIMPNNSALRWEADGVSYSLYGRSLMRDEAVALFSSLRPLN